MPLMLIRVLFVFLLVSQQLLAMGRVQRSDSFLGVRTLHYENEMRHRPVVVEFWYPADRGTPVDVSQDPIWIHPTEVRDAPFRNGQEKYPLLLLSHGHRGGRRDMSWLAEKMVKAGYVVAAVDHHGDTRAHFDPLVSIRFWERSTDLTFLLDHLQKEPVVGERLDFEKIGCVGYSLGGMTSLSLAGATAQRARQAIENSDRSHLLSPEVLERFDFSEAEKSYRDPRIKAIFLMCPATSMYPPESLKQVQIPVGLIASLQDEVLPHQEHAAQIIEYLKLKKLKILDQGISHYAFMNRVSKAGRQVLSRALHGGPIESHRIVLHKEAGEFVVEFFRDVFR